MDVTFNGTKLSTYCKIIGARRDILPSRAITAMKVPNRAGSYFFNRQIDSRVFEVDVMIIGDVRTKADQLAQLLETDKPAPIVFDDDPGKTFFGILTEGTDLAQLREIGKVTLQFFVPDPHAEGTSRSADFADGTASATNSGTAQSFPIITATATKDATVFAVGNGSKIVQVGKHLGAGDNAVFQEQMILNDSCSDLTPWIQGSAANIPVEDGVVNGTLQTNGYSFSAANYGTGSGWHGAGAKRGLSKPLQDFRVDASMQLVASANIQVARINVYLLDVNGAVLARINLKDHLWEYSGGYAYVRARGRNERPLFDDFYPLTNNWQGEAVIKIRRMGRSWWAFIGMYNQKTGSFDFMQTQEFYFADDLYQTKLGQIAFTIDAWGTTAPLQGVALTDLKVIEILPKDQLTAIPYIFRKDDTVQIDMAKASVTKNGDPAVMQYLQPASEFFSLAPGANAIAAFPSDSFKDVKITWKDRWL